MYKEVYVPGELTLEKGTPNVPADGYYYLRKGSSLLLKTKSLKQGREEFARVRRELGGADTLGPHDVQEARAQWLSEITLPKTYKKRKYKPGSTNTFG